MVVEVSEKIVEKNFNDDNFYDTECCLIILGRLVVRCWHFGLHSQPNGELKVKFSGITELILVEVEWKSFFLSQRSM